MDNKDLLAEVASYYSSTLANHGLTPRGVDWNGEEGQHTRFEQLLKIVDAEADAQISINDLGCGYGALFDFLHEKKANCNYVGIDVSSSMIAAAQERYHALERARFIVSAAPDRVADYSVASGVFNVRLGRTDSEWFDYIIKTLDSLDSSSTFGFSFNCLTTYSDEQRRRDDLYYADPCKFFDVCKTRYSRNIAVLHDYGLYEFTVLVRKA